MPRIEIRPFRSGEEEVVAAIRDSGFREWIERLGSEYGERYLTREEVANWVKKGFTPRSTLWIAELEGVPVGYARCGRKGNHMLYLPTDWGYGDNGQSEITIVPEHRRQGIGKTLIQRTLEYYSSEGAEVASVRVYSDNKAASAFLNGLGFARYETDLYLELDLRKPLKRLDLNPKVEVREVREEDVDALAEIYEQSRQEYGPVSRNWILSWLKKQFSVDCDTTLVAEYDGRIVGLMAFLVNHTLDIPGVLPKYRRRGIGSTLFCHVLKRMQEKGYPKAIVGVNLRNEDAIKMYQRFSFDIARKFCRWTKRIS